MSSLPIKTYQLSFLLPTSVATRIHLQLTIQSHHLLLFLTTRSPETAPGPAPLGSFVYALPSTTQLTPLSTPLYVREDSLETATRIAKVLAKKTERPVCVGCSMSFSSQGRGGDVDEQIGAVRRVIDVVVTLTTKARDGEDVEIPDIDGLSISS